MKTKNNAIRSTFLYSLVQGMFWMNFAVLMGGYSSIYLLDRGLSNGMIGLIIGIAGISAALIQPLLASYADKPSAKSIKWLVGALLFIAILISGSMLALHGKSGLLTGILFGLCIAILQTVLPFVNSLGTESISQGIPVNWGFARGIGSAAYAVLASFLGVVVSKIGPFSIPVSVLIGYTVFLLCVVIFPFRKSVSDKQQQKTSSTSMVTFLRKHPKFSLLLLGFTCAYISHVVLNSFLFQIIESKGGTSVEMGNIMAICALVELPALFFYSLFQKKASSDVWVRVSTVFIALKAIGSLLAASMGMFYAVQIFQALGWALISIAPVYYVRSTIPQEDAIKGQACVTMTYTAGSVLATVIGGRLLDIGGTPAILILSSVAGVLGCVITMIFTERNIKE